VAISMGISVIGRTIDAIDSKHAGNGMVPSRHQDEGTEGFFADLLSDRHGISVHRFQYVIFTLLLMTGFIINVYQNGKMPEFDDTLLILLSMSGAGYLALKLNENK
jgi:hypothetical protein